jgi:hypothetical protein
MICLYNLVEAKAHSLEMPGRFAPAMFTRLAPVLPKRQLWLHALKKFTARAAHGHGYLDIDPLFP